MEDTRKEKREQEFFSLPNFETVKKKREEFLVSLRKKKKLEKFNLARKQKSMQNLINDDYYDGLIDYTDLHDQFELDLEALGV